jgi:hypothetical protein
MLSLVALNSWLNRPILDGTEERKGMSLEDGRPINDRDTSHEPPMSAELIALLRHRIASRFYDEPQVIDAIARAILNRPA